MKDEENSDSETVLNREEVRGAAQQRCDVSASRYSDLGPTPVIHSHGQGKHSVLDLGVSEEFVLEVMAKFEVSPEGHVAVHFLAQNKNNIQRFCEVDVFSEEENWSEVESMVGEAPVSPKARMSVDYSSEEFRDVIKESAPEQEAKVVA